jgi:hypothetical protein
MTKGSSFWDRWLLIVAVLMATFGLAMAVFNQTPWFDAFRLEIDRVFWPEHILPTGVAVFQAWIYSAWGATVAGLGVFAAYVARHAFANRQRWARDCILVGLLVWYIPDTAASLISRLAFNAIFNTVVLVFALLPVVAVWKEFRDALDR